MTAEPTLRVIDIIPGTSVDGPGLRTSIYFAGCAHQCEGCHNPQSWSFDAGQNMTISEIVAVIEENGFNVTFTGGDPLYQIIPLTALAEELVKRGYKIWCFTGFLFEEVEKLPGAANILPYLDVIVDGPFKIAQRNTSLIFRGSENQRLIDVRRTLQSGEITQWSESSIHWS